MKLVQDWPQFYKWWSVHGALVVAIVSAAYALMQPLQSVIPPTVYAWSMSVLGVAIIVLRVLQQGATNGTNT